MCGRYVLFTDEEEDDIADLVRDIQQRLYGGGADPSAPVAEEDKKKALRANGEIFPSQTVPVITVRGPEAYAWGLPGFKGKGLIINARAESVYEKSFYRQSAQCRRVVVPSHGFFEWKDKQKFLFNLPDSRTLYMAGLYNEYDDGPRFAIITTAANPSMIDVHDRMPVILLPSEIGAYLGDDAASREAILRVPPELIMHAA